jgi:epoxyqueuosine reductase QueG
MSDRKMIRRWISDFVQAFPDHGKVETRWKEPLTAVANAKDPLYHELKQIIGPTHAMPDDIVAGAESVIVFFVPFAEYVSMSNIPDEESSREWDYAYIETNQMLAALNEFLYKKITERGYKASNLPPTYNYDAEMLISDWSHRSSAYIAGLGTFGIHNMLITESGCCGRLSSVITDWKLEPDKRPDHEYCLYKRDGSCGLCLIRCVNNAFMATENGVHFDRFLCNLNPRKLYNMLTAP